jgi:8-oxo-dGTP pyrophosphatase MutT (NUDIX family)
VAVTPVMLRTPPEFRPDRPTVAEVAAGAVLTTRAPPFAILLIHERSEDRWCFPKGHVEPGESALEAARREVEEETGLADFSLEEELAAITYRFYQPRHRRSVVKTSIYYLGRSERTDPHLEPGFDRFVWATPSEARRLVSYEQDRAVVDAAARRLRRSRRPAVP